MTLVPKTVNVTPAANTVTVLYSPGGGKWAQCSTLKIHNDNAALTVQARVMFAAAAAADDRTQREYDVTIPPNDTFASTDGLALNGTDTIRVWADTANVNFLLSMQEGP
jgi:hypothetical protein